MSHYDTLGVDENADAAAIKLAYRRAMRASHADMVGEAGADAAAAANVAYEVLSNPEKRAAYDASRKAPESPAEPTGATQSPVDDDWGQEATWEAPEPPEPPGMAPEPRIKVPPVVTGPADAMPATGIVGAVAMAAVAVYGLILGYQDGIAPSLVLITFGVAIGVGALIGALARARSRYLPLLGFSISVASIFALAIAVGLILPIGGLLSQAVAGLIAYVTMRSLCDMRKMQTEADIIINKGLLRTNNLFGTISSQSMSMLEKYLYSLYDIPGVAVIRTVVDSTGITHAVVAGRSVFFVGYLNCHASNYTMKRSGLFADGVKIAEPTWITPHLSMRKLLTKRLGVRTHTVIAVEGAGPVQVSGSIFNRGRVTLVRKEGLPQVVSDSARVAATNKVDQDIVFTTYRFTR